MTDQSATPTLSVPANHSIPVWDLPTRLFHWVLVIAVCVLFYTGLQGKLDLHMKFGQFVLGLLLFRLIWGFIGNRQARFSDFIAGPAAAIAYLRGLFGKGGPKYLGHNPVGGYAVLLMLALLLVQASTGLFASDDIATDGPLYSKVSSSLSARLSTLHRLGFDALLVIILIHLASNAFYLLVKRENLITPMVTGNKTVSGGASAPVQGAGPVAALVIFVVCEAVVFGGIAWLAK
ncbi:cytochrome b/b6 domain-containing protein [Ferrovibrio sp.]|uniref:cytochrome b/b6 domain-containing protein n=1 Tax=Ferrovibrio sp. TaxID=1917215 RepID=UPI003D285D24